MRFTEDDYCLMEAIHQELLELTRGCRPTMHEPDEQGVSAYVTGHVLDNAGVASRRCAMPAEPYGVLCLPIDDGVGDATFLVADIDAAWVADIEERCAWARDCARFGDFSHITFYDYGMRPVYDVPPAWLPAAWMSAAAASEDAFAHGAHIAWGHRTAELPSDAWVAGGHPLVTLLLDVDGDAMWELQYDGPPDMRAQTGFVALAWLRARGRWPEREAQP